MRILDSPTDFVELRLPLRLVGIFPFQHAIIQCTFIEAVIFVLGHHHALQITFISKPFTCIRSMFILQGTKVSIHLFYICVSLFIVLPISNLNTCIILSHQCMNEYPACFLFLYLHEQRQAEDNLLCLCLGFLYSIIDTIRSFGHLIHRFL